MWYWTASPARAQPQPWRTRWVDGSKAPDDALAALELVEDPESKVRIIVSVGMLKEGWDVKNVYAICSLRPLLSDVLTEQTLGRGLRLPWGAYTGVPLLDTLEVLAHDKYEALLKKTSAINEEFVDYRTRLVVRKDTEGKESAHVETSKADVEITIGERDGAVGIVEQDERESEAADEVTHLNEELRPRGDLPALEIPRLKMTKVELKFSLADITELDAFEKLGRRLASEPEDDLRRMELGARIVTSSDGLRRTELVTTTGDRIVSKAKPIPLDEARARLLDALLGAEIVPPHASEAHAAERIVDAFLRGLGDGAERVLSAFLDRAAASLVRGLTAEHRRFVGKPQYDEVIETTTFAPVRVARPKSTHDRTGAFSRSVGYEGWSRSMYLQAWFDSSTERTLVSILDDADEITLLGASQHRRPADPVAERRARVQPGLHRGRERGDPLAGRGEDGEGTRELRCEGQGDCGAPVGQPCLRQDACGVALPARRRDRHPGRPRILGSSEGPRSRVIEDPDDHRGVEGDPASRLAFAHS